MPCRILLIIGTLNLVSTHFVGGSCFLKNEKSILCCLGRNHSCSGFDKTGIQSSGKQVKCYCDEHCMRTGDCCSDYEKWCGLITTNCLVSNWGPWSACSSSCGAGEQKRFRKILIHPTYNGKKCEPQQQARVCLKKSCIDSNTKYKRKRHQKLKTDSLNIQLTVQIVPLITRNHIFTRMAGFDQNDTREISTINLAEQDGSMYCATYHVTNVSPSCKVLQNLSKREQLYWKSHSQYLKIGHLVCLTCSNKQVHSCNDGHVLNKLTKWIAARSDNCYGQFRMVYAPKLCQCHQGPMSYSVI